MTRLPLSPPSMTVRSESMLFLHLQAGIISLLTELFNVPVIDVQFVTLKSYHILFIYLLTELLNVPVIDVQICYTKVLPYIYIYLLLLPHQQGVQWPSWSSVWASWRARGLHRDPFWGDQGAALPSSATMHLLAPPHTRQVPPSSHLTCTEGQGGWVSVIIIIIIKIKGVSLTVICNWTLRIFLGYITLLRKRVKLYKCWNFDCVFCPTGRVLRWHWPRGQTCLPLRS